MSTLGRTIVVDLDGTLIHSDTLFESYFVFLRSSPFLFWLPFVWLFGGKANLKKNLANHVTPDAQLLPYNVELIKWLKEQKMDGASLILATAADHRIARAVFDHLGFFDEFIATNGVNLSSHNKRDRLIKKFGDRGYEYVGNSRADLAVWESAAVIHMVNPGFGVASSAKKLSVPQGSTFQDKPGYLHSLLKALRLHQWIKNALIFVPLLASHRFLEGELIFDGLIAFLSFSLCASSVYLLNDLIDLPEDRRHNTKRNRPLAAGSLPIMHALLLFPVLLLSAFTLSIFFLPWEFVSVLGGYYALTLAYSLWLKRMVMLDVVTLSMLYTSRVIAGAAAMSLVATFWILAFSTFIFLSLAMIKRYTELFHARQNGIDEKAAGRDYYPADFELLASLGGASGFISVLILALYINDSADVALYQSPEWMWLSLPILLYWLSRVWLLAHRGEMHDDPIVFAIRDNVSRWTGVLFLATFGLATL